MNRVTLCGRLGQDPELKYTTTGTAVCNFSMATSEKFKNKTSGQTEEKTEWHRVVCWGKTAEYASKYLKKGGQVLIEGKLTTRTWEDNQGNKRYTTEIVSSQIENLSFSGGNSEQGTGQSQNTNNNTQQDYNVQTDPGFAADDIPF